MLLSAIIVTAVTVPSALIIALGYGDKLIAGYNTASEEERKKVNIKRLRGLVAGLLTFCAAIYWLPVIIGKEFPIFINSILIMIAALITVILANTWAKKK